MGTQMRTHMRTQMGDGGNSVVRTRWEHREKKRALAVLSPFSCRALAVFALCRLAIAAKNWKNKFKVAQHAV